MGNLFRAKIADARHVAVAARGDIRTRGDVGDARARGASNGASARGYGA